MPNKKNNYNGYLELLKRIKENKDDDKYEPKNYDFNLDSLDEKGNIKNKE